MKLKDLMPEGDKKPIKKTLNELTAKKFMKAVEDEYDTEVLDLMMNVIQKRKDFLAKMQDIAKGGRTVVKGFRK